MRRWTWQHSLLVATMFLCSAPIVAAYIAVNPHDLPLAGKIYVGSTPFLLSLSVYLAYRLD